MIQFVSRSSWRCDVPTVNCSPSTTIAQCPAELTHFSLFLMTDTQPFPQRILRRVRCNAASFNLQNFLLSFRSSSSCQCFVLRLSILHSIFLSITWCVRQFLNKIWPIQLTFLLYIVCSVFPLPASLHLPHDRSNWSSPSFSSTTFRNFQCTFDLLPATTKFQHRTKLCSKCSTLLVSSSNLSSIFWWTESPSCAMLNLPWRSWI